MPPIRRILMGKAKPVQVESSSAKQPNNTKDLFLDLQNTVHRYLRLDKESDYFIDLVLASAISIELDKPIWSMIEAPSSSGKTEILKLLENEENFKKVFTLTRKTLFSGHTDAHGGFIPSKIGDQGILCFPDFTSVLSMRSDDRAEVFNQLRVAYDGEAGSATGVDIDKMVTWHGKLSCLACVTGAIEKYKDKASDLGERFLYLNHTVPPFENSFKVNPSKKLLATNAGNIAHELIHQAKGNLDRTDLLDDDRIFINRLANLIAQSRAVVERGSGSSRAVEHVHAPEEPYRLIEQLESLLRCLYSIHGTKSNRPYELLKVIATSSIPENRWKLMKAVYRSGSDSVSELATKSGLVEITTRRVVEDLEMRGIFQSLLTMGRRNANVSALVDSIRKEIRELGLI
jgi:hypothetical protein